MAKVRKALVIEDRADWRAQLTRLLEKKNLEVRAVETEYKARAILQSDKARDRGFALIILDLRLVEWRDELEGMKLLDLTDRRAETDNSKVIIVTSHGGVLEAREAFGQHQVFDFIPKSSDDTNFDFYELFQERVGKALGEYDSQQQSDD